MIDQPRPTCSTCPYWDERAVDINKGSCHRNPAVLLKGPDDFCGEHPDFPAYIATIREQNAGTLPTRVA